MEITFIPLVNFYKCQVYGRATGFYKYLLAWVYRNVYKNKFIELLKHVNT